MISMSLAGTEGPRETAGSRAGVGASPSPCFPAPRCDLLQVEVVRALLELLVFGFHRFAQFLQNLGWREMEMWEKPLVPSSVLPTGLYLLAGSRVSPGKSCAWGDAGDLTEPMPSGDLDGGCKLSAYPLVLLFFLEENGDFLGANPSPYPIKPCRYSPMYPKTSVHVTMGAGKALGAASLGTRDTVLRMRMVCGLKAASGASGATIAGARWGWDHTGGSFGVSRKSLTPPRKGPGPGLG